MAGRGNSVKEEVKNTEQLTGKENAVQVLKFVLFSISAGIVMGSPIR